MRIFLDVQVQQDLSVFNTVVRILFSLLIRLTDKPSFYLDFFDICFGSLIEATSTFIDVTESFDLFILQLSIGVFKSCRTAFSVEFLFCSSGKICCKCS